MHLHVVDALLVLCKVGGSVHPGVRSDVPSAEITVTYACEQVVGVGLKYGCQLATWLGSE